MYGSLLGLEARSCLVTGDLLARPFASLRELFRDLRLDARQIVLVDRLGEIEVVVEAVLDRRADRDLHAGIEPAHRFGEQMRRRVAQHGERVGVARVPRRQDLDRLAVAERQAQVLHLPVRADEHRLLGELRTDRARGVETGRAVGKLELGLIGKDNFHQQNRIFTARTTRFTTDDAMRTLTPFVVCITNLREVHSTKNIDKMRKGLQCKRPSASV